ncbi:MAG TPA: hypothetical protein VEQ36_08450 [Thermomicrobiales bacterium]|nr:hypothetical protein [Thermomicrobiales bacterium]
METIKAWIARITGPKRPGTAPDGQSPRDFAGEREADRSGQMGAEDQAWEADRQQRNRDGQSPDTAPPTQD